MKKFLLLFFLLFFSSCSSPEKEIKKSFSQRVGNSSFLRVKNIEIYDTLYLSDIDRNLMIFQDKLKYLRREMAKTRMYRDSVLRLDISKNTLDSLLKIGIDYRMSLDQQIESTIFKQSFNQHFITQIYGNVAGYYAKITTNRDTLYFLVSPITYQITCPLFMFEQNF